MPLKTQVCPLSKAMDFDSGDKYINTSDGFVRERIGMRTNELDGNSLFNNKLKGNVLIDIELPAGTNKCIGWTQDFKTESIIWFVYNSLGSHSILRYFIITGTIQKIWYSQSGLMLVDDLLCAKVVDGRIYWVNGSEKPKSFNLERAVNYTNSLTGSTYEDPIDLKNEILPWIKRPPQLAPSAEYISVTEEVGLIVDFNNLRGKLFQFKYSFVYEDDQESAYSEISKIPLPEGDLTVSGDWVSEYSRNNAIKILVYTGSSIVKKINVAARVILDTNEGDFFLFKTIDKFDSDSNRIIDDYVPYQINFLNNNNIRNINTDINSRYCDDIPISSNSVELLDGKYLSMAMPIKGYDPIISDLILTHSFVGNIDYGASVRAIETFIITGVYGQTNYYITFSNPVSLNSTYRLTITFGDNSNVVAEYAVHETDPGIVVIRNSIFNNLVSDTRLDSGEILKVDDAFFTNAILVKVKQVPTSSQIKSVTASIESGSISSFKSFKRAQYHQIGIVYNDEFGRYNVVNNESTIFVPYHEVNTDYDKLSRISFEIRHRPPVWAKTYRFVYKKKASYTYFIDVVNTEAILGGVDNIPAGHTFIKLNQAIKFYRDTNSNVKISDYVWIKGDRCRSFYQRDSGNPIFEISPFVRKYKPTTDTDAEEDGFVIKGSMPTYLQSGTGKRFVDIEVFRPNTEFSGNIFYETGDSFDILDSGTDLRRHSATRTDIANGGVDQSSDLIIPASGYFTFGDVYMRARIFPGGAPVIIEDSEYSDFYSSEATDIGRAVVKITGGSEQKKLHRVVKSENFIEDTEYNLLNVFLPQSEFLPVSQSYGEIAGIKEVGDVLKVIQEHKETSIYIGKSSLKQADGTNITVISDKVFNQGNKYDSLFGTKYPHSIAANDRNLYYFDDTTGDFIRSAPNGQASISEEYRMKTYFKAKADELRISTNFTDIITAIDSNYDEVLITFINGNESETIAFYEKEGLKGFVWKAQIKPASGVFDNMGWYGNKLFSFLGGKIYEQNTGNLNEFFGDQKDCSISFVVNAGSGDANKFSDIEISSNKNIWDVRFDIEEGVNYPVQKTILKPSIIRKKENRLYSPILRNILGRNNAEDLSKLRSGQQMTGESILVTISNSTSEDVTLKEVEVKFLTAK